MYKCDIRFEMAVSDAVPEMAVVPRSMLTQILLNLGLNAIKHAGAGKEVFLNVETNFDNNLECQICDRGPGIVDESQVGGRTGKASVHMILTEQQVFSKGRKRSATSGTGLGLEVCQSLCELIRGKLKYKRNGKRGSIFYVEFRPRPRDPQAVRKFVSQQPASVATVAPEHLELTEEENERQKLHMLVVDDATVNVMVLQNLLTKRLNVSESCCASAVDGFAALQYCLGWCRDGGKTPLVVFMDREMPGMDGEACARHWRQLEQELGVKRPAYIVAVSAGQGSMTSCDERLDKPIQLVQLSNILSSVTRQMPQEA